jgi:flavin-binding protein dodecin
MGNVTLTSARPSSVETSMAGDHVYRKTELVGSSATSLTDAIETAIARAAKTLRHLEWFEVSEIRGHVQDGKVAHYQVALKVGFRIEE